MLSGVLQKIVLQTNRFFVLRFFYICIYSICRKIIVKRLSMIPGVVSIYARGGTFRDTETPGDSDIDFVVIISKQDYQQEAGFIERLTKVIFFWSKIIPFFHVRVLLGDNFALYFSLKQLQLWKPFSFKLEHVFGEKLDLLTCNIAVNRKELLALIVRRYRDFTHELFILPDKKRIRHLVKYADYITTWATEAYWGREVPGLKNARSIIETAKKSQYCLKDYLGLGCKLWLSVEEIVRNFIVFDRDSEAARESVFINPLSITAYKINQQTRSTACKSSVSFIKELKAQSGYIKSVILSSNISSNYQYFFYIILHDEISLSYKERAAICSILAFKALKNKISYYLTEGNMFFSSGCFNYCLHNGLLPGGALESIHLIRNAVTIYGDDILGGADINGIIDRCSYVSRWDFANNVVLNAPIASDPYRNMLGLHKENIKLIVKSLDIILSGMPARRMLLQDQIVTTTPEETLSEYMELYKSEPETEIYKDIYTRFYGVAPEDIDLESINGALPQLRKFTQLVFSEIEASIKYIAANNRVVG